MIYANQGDKGHFDFVQGQMNMVMFSADFVMNMQVLIFINRLTFVEYRNRAFTAEATASAACTGMFKIVYEGQIRELSYALDFGQDEQSVHVYAEIFDPVNTKAEILDDSGKDLSSRNSREVDIPIKDTEDAKKLAQELVTWLMVDVGKIQKN